MKCIRCKHYKNNDELNSWCGLKHFYVARPRNQFCFKYMSKWNLLGWIKNTLKF